MSDPKSSFVGTIQMDTELAWNPFRSSSLVVEDYSLEVISGPHEGLEFCFEQDIVEVGRSEYCHIVLVEDRRISTQHCEISLDSGGVRVRDLESRNGIFLDGHQVFDAYIKPGAHLQIGKSVLVLKSNKAQKEIQLDYFDGSGQLVGQSPKMRRLFSLMARLGTRSMPVMFTGETGTGKTSVARALHDQGERKSMPFIMVNCAAIPENLIESELFGYEPGAFTGAGPKAHKGFFEQAHKGTLFLDEIGELPVALQAKLLDVVERQCVRRLRGEREIEVDFRLMTATNQNLQVAIEEKRFREDLYFRIAVVEVEVPPLRERREDLPLLIELMLSEFCPFKVSLTLAAQEKLKDYVWPGNIRQLRNVLERTTAFLEQNIIDTDDLLLPNDRGRRSSRTVSELASGEHSSPSPEVLKMSAMLEEGVTLKDFMEKTESGILFQALKAVNWDVREAARRLDISKSWLYKRIDKYELKKE